MSCQKDPASANSPKHPSDRGGVAFDGGLACWIGGTVPRKIHRYDLELTREAVHLVPPGVSAAAAAMNQDEPLTPKRPPPARVDQANG